MSYLGRSRHLLSRSLQHASSRTSQQCGVTRAVHQQAASRASVPPSTNIATVANAKKERAAAAAGASATPTPAAAVSATSGAADAGAAADSAPSSSSKLLYSLVGCSVALALVFTINEDARAWAWREFPELCKVLNLPRQEQPVKKVVTPAVTRAPTPVVLAPTPVAPKQEERTLDPVVQARLEEVLVVKAPAVAPAAPTTTKPTTSSLPAPPKAVEKRPAPKAATSIVPPPSPELTEILRTLAEAEASIAPFMREQDALIHSELGQLEEEIKSRELHRLVALEVDQLHTLRSSTQIQDRQLFSKDFDARAPSMAKFREDRGLEEENKWRQTLFNALKDVNESMSQFADHWLQVEEKQLRSRWTGHVQQLRNATAALDAGRLKDLRAKLSQARHAELRSKQAHRLSAALLTLGEVVDQNHVGFESSWRVVQEVAKADNTLAAAVASVDRDTVSRGIYSIATLKQAFAAASAELKRTTFLPDRVELWTLGRQALAHLFAAFTLTETGGVIIPVQTPTTSNSSANAAAAPAADLSHQSADYAHYINASTYLNSNALELALAELEAMQPSRRATVQAFIDELRKTVQVQNAIRVVRMRVLAMHDAAAAIKA